MAALLVCQPSLAYETADNSPTGIAMATDLLVARPVLLVTTAVGSVIWLVALPFSALGGNVKESGQQLVVGPAKATFMRCLGCEMSGYQYNP
ncbi:MAG: hypothetical protein DRR06_07475 [Gammaproteobacteria bacterium]|nr:MAG: hypothetical protein DRR06_07475 [Gammaproteobacteria bacterium]RLA54072.1 MAG: hypothetical protein DRR42_03045 [Gammaproteobacteria bacterium]